MWGIKMYKFLVHCDSGFCGVNEDVIVTADCASDAEEIAYDWWFDTVSPVTVVELKIDKDNAEEYEGYEEIN